MQDFTLPKLIAARFHRFRRIAGDAKSLCGECRGRSGTIAEREDGVHGFVAELARDLPRGLAGILEM